MRGNPPPLLTFSTISSIGGRNWFVQRRDREEEKGMCARQKTRFFSLNSAFIIIIVAQVVCFPADSSAQLSEISEDDLSQITAQAGINITYGQTGMLIDMDSFRFSDTDHDPHNWIELNNVTIDDGQGGFFSLDTPFNVYDVNMLDIGTDSSGRTLLYLNISTHVEPRTLTVDNVVFCDQDLGGIQVGNLTGGASDRLTIGGRTDGGCGIDLEYRTRIDIDSVEYTYNTQQDSLLLSGIHLCQYATGSPEDPTSWEMLGKFMIGDLENNKPVTMDIGTDAEGNTSILYNFPMSGSARIEGVSFGGNDFGPCAIDGINVHHLAVQIPGN